MKKSPTPRLPHAQSVPAAASPAAAGLRPAGAALAIAAAFLGWAPVQAQSTGAQAVHGQASVSQQGGNVLVTTQNGPGTSHSAINWQSFSVPGGSTTRFQQPTAASLSINRVVGGNPSAIYGTLSSNGRLVLVNPSGIAVGAGAVVDTAGFTASTLRMSDADALAGRLVFGGDGLGGGALTVDGKIVARSGDAVLIAPSVQVGRQAVVQSPNGATLLAAGQKVELTGRGLEGIRMELQAPGDQALNLGILQGDAVGIFAGQLKHSGLIQATAVSAQGGRVVLKAGAGDALVDGRISARSATHGGAIDVLGERVGLLAGAELDASGESGGGFIRVGGDFQGSNAQVANARRTYVDRAAAINADAGGNGNGGRVIVWADDQTQSFGSISARGGALGGDGGFVEVSGKQRLAFDSKVDTRAPVGRTGTLLLDPNDIIVTSATSASPYGGPVMFGDAPATLMLNVATINSATTDVLLQANNDITVSAAINIAQPGVGFTAQAGRYLTVNAPITTMAGAVNLVAGDPGSTTAPSGNGLYINANIDTTGAGTVPAGAAVSLVADEVYISTSGLVNSGLARTVIRPGSITRGIALGSSDDANKLALSQAELSNVTAGTLVVGGAGYTGGLQIDSPIVVGSGALSLIQGAGSSITQAGGATITVNRLNADAGTVSLAEANSVSEISGRASSASGGGFAFHNDGGGNLVVGTVDGIAGIHSGTGPSNPNSIMLSANNGDVSQTQGLKGASLTVAAGGNVLLESPDNTLGAIDATGSGDVRMLNNFSGATNLNAAAGGSVVYKGFGQLVVDTVSAGSPAVRGVVPVGAIELEADAIAAATSGGFINAVSDGSVWLRAANGTIGSTASPLDVSTQGGVQAEAMGKSGGVHLATPSPLFRLQVHTSGAASISGPGAPAMLDLLDAHTGDALGWSGFSDARLGVDGGKVSAGGPITADSNVILAGTLAPGGEGVSSMKVAGDLQVLHGATMKFDFNGNQHDTISVGGDVTFPSGQAGSTAMINAPAQPLHGAYTLISGATQGDLPTVAGNVVGVSLAYGSLIAHIAGSAQSQIAALAGSQAGQVIAETGTNPLTIFTELLAKEEEQQNAQGKGLDNVVDDNQCRR